MLSLFEIYVFSIMKIKFQTGLGHYYSLCINDIILSVHLEEDYADYGKL